MKNGTAVQFQKPSEVATLWVPVIDPEHIQENGDGLVTGITIHLSVEDAEFLERYAAYRNHLADARKERLKTRYSRKSMAERLLKTQLQSIRAQLATMTGELGELPPKKPIEGAKKYGKRAADWLKKRSS